jgi:hypothetical protein
MNDLMIINMNGPILEQLSLLAINKSEVVASEAGNGPEYMALVNLSADKFGIQFLPGS